MDYRRIKSLDFTESTRKRKLEKRNIIKEISNFTKITGEEKLESVRHTEVKTNLSHYRHVITKLQHYRYNRNIFREYRLISKLFSVYLIFFMLKPSSECIFIFFYFATTFKQNFKNCSDYVALL